MADNLKRVDIDCELGESAPEGELHALQVHLAVDEARSLLLDYRREARRAEDPHDEGADDEEKSE